ncbi:hypothetical protein RAB80_017041 [Fusarium oxysporum f. sp. vasinfectum]|nr:hypothetical protein RAB80_017041 [Fusarium oxysporum f. sp. vasinfectum]
MDQLSVDRTIHRKRHSGATPTITGERTPKYESAYIEFRGPVLPVQNRHGDGNYQLLIQATPKMLVHTGGALSNLSPEFGTASALQESFGSQPQQQFHLDQEPPALFATEGAAATPIRTHGKYPCPFDPLEAKAFAPLDSLKRHNKPYCDNYLQRAIKHAQEAESCDITSHKAKQKENTRAIKKSTLSPAEDNDAQSKISILKIILPELEGVDLSKIPGDEGRTVQATD